MTLIVGIKCTEGIVLAADGAATYGSMGQQTIRQDTRGKLKIIDGKVVIGTSGPVGLGQRISGEVEELWKEKKFKGMNPTKAMTFLRETLWNKHVGFEMNAAGISAKVVGNQVASIPALSSTILAVPISHELCLFQFDHQCSPEAATNDLPFIALGSGQNIADPFLAFLRRIFWPCKMPTLSEGTLCAIWTLKHAIDTNPGGVSDPMQVIQLQMQGATPKAEELSPEKIQGENIEAIIRAEKLLADSFRNESDEAAVIPSPPPAE